MKILTLFEVERVVTEDEQNEFDEAIIGECVKECVPICFEMHAHDIEVYKEKAKEMQLENINLVIHVKRNKEKRFYDFYNEKLKKIKSL